MGVPLPGELNKSRAGCFGAGFKPLRIIYEYGSPLSTSAMGFHQGAGSIGRHCFVGFFSNRGNLREGTLSVCIWR